MSPDIVRNKAAPGAQAVSGAGSYLSFQARSFMKSSSSSEEGVVSFEMWTNSISSMFAKSLIISAVTSYDSTV